MNQVNQKIIDAIIAKAERVCPDSLLLIGLYGSAATGDVHPKSDLDLLILVGDDKGRRLADGFILEDAGIGYDIYCTGWEMLEGDARCGHAHLSRLLDCKIVYVKDPAALTRLKALQDKARALLASDQRKENARAAMAMAKAVYADAFLAESLSKVRTCAGAAIHYLLDAMMLHHGQYFRLGVKRTFEELSPLSLPFDLEAMVLSVIRGETAEDIRTGLTALMRCVRDHLNDPMPKEQPSEANLKGTYEEMFSNWRNKMGEAAQRGDLYSSFMNLVSFQFMLGEIAAGVDIPDLDAMAKFDPLDLHKNAEAFDAILAQYREEYRKIGLEPKVLPNADAFLAQYE